MCFVPCSGDGRIVLSDSALKKEAEARGLPPPMPAVDLDLEKVIFTSGYIVLIGFLYLAYVHHLKGAGMLNNDIVVTRRCSLLDSA